MTRLQKPTTKLHVAKIKHKDINISDKDMTKVDTTDTILNLSGTDTAVSS